MPLGLQGVQAAVVVVGIVAVVGTAVYSVAVVDQEHSPKKNKEVIII